MSIKRGFWSNLFSGGDNVTGSANLATERLKVIVASENRLNTRLNPERIDKMKLEILEVVNRYVNGVKMDDVNIQHRHEDTLDVLEMNINLPDRINQ